jgi:hypothetical protein
VKASDESWLVGVADYAAGSFQFSACRLVRRVGFGVAAVVMKCFPGVLKDQDPDMMVLMILVVPMLVTAVSVKIWGRKWRIRRVEVYKTFQA